MIFGTPNSFPMLFASLGSYYFSFEGQEDFV